MLRLSRTWGEQPHPAPLASIDTMMRSRDLSGSNVELKKKQKEMDLKRKRD
jgi:hypothetical protein